MRKLSKLVPRADLDAASHSADLWQFAYTDLAGGFIEWAETSSSSDGWLYTFRLSRCQGGIGGILVIIRAVTGQRPFVSVHHAEDVRRAGMVEMAIPADCNDLWCHFTSALYRLQRD
jgi:hypothetical protein